MSKPSPESLRLRLAKARIEADTTAFVHEVDTRSNPTFVQSRAKDDLPPEVRARINGEEAEHRISHMVDLQRWYLDRKYRQPAPTAAEVLGPQVGRRVERNLPT